MRNKSRRALEDDPMSPVVGERVGLALAWRGYSAKEAARRIGERGPVAGAISQQALSDIIAGKTKRCHRERLRALARLCGAPITLGYLAGTEGLRVPALLWPPSGTGSRLALPIDLTGQATSERDQISAPPRYELEAARLGTELAGAVKREARPIAQPAPNMGNVARWALSLVFWREFLFDGQAHGATGRELQEESADFAYHAGAALRLLFAPWRSGKVTMRRNLFGWLVGGLDSVAEENEEMHHERVSGRYADLAARDATLRRKALAEQLRAYVSAQRAAGHSETEIAARLLHWDDDEDDVPEE